MRGAILKLNDGISGIDSVTGFPFVIPFEDVIYDTDSLFSLGSDIIIPAGVSFISVHGSWQHGGVTADVSNAAILQNSAEAPCGSFYLRDNTGTAAVCYSPILPVSEGDQIQLRADSYNSFSSSSISDAIQQTYLAVEIIESLNGALVTLDADLTGLTFPTNVVFNNEVVDVGDWWSPVDGSKFIVPAGVSRVELVAGVQVPDANTNGSIVARILKNGAEVSVTSGLYVHRNEVYANPNPIIPKNAVYCHVPFDTCVPGDEYTFEVDVINLNSPTSVLATARTLFAIKELPLRVGL